MFSFVKSATNPNFPIIKQLPTTASTTYKIGEALVLTDGGLTQATGTTKPQFIWETTCAADASAVKAGSKVTIHTDAAQVTATTTGGVFMLLSAGGAVGAKVVEKF